MANIYGKLKAVTADGVLADAEQIEETATGKSVAVALKDLRRAVQGQIDPSVINVDAYTKKETDDKIEALSKDCYRRPRNLRYIRESCAEQGCQVVCRQYEG